ncbi:MAG: hypothetical protein JJE52_09275 [Acidimicrobiia bacterium]|nr:hypothetical protein [Acidimicrobiia bacterium]
MPALVEQIAELHVGLRRQRVVARHERQPRQLEQRLQLEIGGVERREDESEIGAAIAQARGRIGEVALDEVHGPNSGGLLAGGDHGEHLAVHRVGLEADGDLAALLAVDRRG